MDRSDLTPISARRRRLLAAAWSLAATGWLAPPIARLAFAQRFERDPFTLGVASGCPRADGVVLWTRLAPDPLAGGGLSPEPVLVRWELATDEHFGDIVRKGNVTADAQFAHSVHVELNGLNSDRMYWYRFMAGDAVSPIGRTRTAPAVDADLTHLRYAFASCQQYEHGYYGAYRHMAAEDIDLVVFLGDYIYESSWGRRHVRKHSEAEPTTLQGYRNRHAQHKTDPDLQHMHALVPWILTWDDHEVANDYADAQGQFLEPDFIQRRAAAYRAYYEHMPLERAMRPRGPDMRIFDAFTYGRLAQFHLLDDRQYRHVQVCPSPKKRGGSNVVSDAQCPERNDPQRSLLGRAQETWLHERLDRSQARWNVLAQQSIMAQVNQSAATEPTFWTDSWDGYPDARKRLLDYLGTRKPSNPIVIGGDVHCHWVCDLKADFDRASSPTVASEFCGTSISSQSWPHERVVRMLPNNPHAKFASAERRGYVVMELSKGRCEVALRGIDDEKRHDTGVQTQARFIVEDGRPGPQRA